MFTQYDQMVPQKHGSLRRGFTMVELLLVLSIVSVLGAFLLGVVARAREGARRSTCISNQKQIAVALQQYVDDADGLYPAGTVDAYDKTCFASQWSMSPSTLASMPLLSQQMQPYARSGQVFIDPATQDISDNDADGGACSLTKDQLVAAGMSYVQRTQLSLPQPVPVASVANASGIDVLHCFSTFHGTPDPAGRWSMVLFLDGHVKGMPRTQMQQVSMTPLQF